MKAKFVRKNKEAENIYTFWFAPERPVNYIAGQYVEMTLDHDHPDERGIRHWFTLSSSPTDAPLFSVTTKFVDGLESTFKKSLQEVEEGHEVLISEPMGDFVLPKDDSIPLVFIAGGIGITPFHSIVRWLHETKQERDITFLYSVNNENEIVFQKEFEHYGMRRKIIINNPLGAWDGETGQLTGQRILEFAKSPSVKGLVFGNDSLFYISGPEAMVEALQADLESLGITKSRLVGDFFPGYTKV